MGLDWSEFNESSVLLLGSWGRLPMAVFGVLALLVLAMTWADLHDLPRRRALVLTGLRGLALGMVLLFLLEPALELRSVTRVPNEIAVVVDMSQSQSLPADDRATRWDRTRAALQTLDETLRDSDEHTIAWYRLDGDLQRTTRAALLDGAALPDGNDTRLLEGLESLRRMQAGRDLGGVVLISDGADHGRLGRRNRDDAEDPLDEESLRTLRGLGGPVHTLATTGATPPRDISLERVRHDDFAFVRNAFTVEVDLRATGFNEELLRVDLFRNGQLLRSRETRVRNDDYHATLGFPIVPELLGREVYTLHVTPRVGEAVIENNTHHFVIEVIRDRIRVLQVVGRPSWDVRFLRQLLKENPNVDLVSFFILRSNDDLHRAANHEMSLIPFPTDELFREQLGSFDLVVFQNFGFEPYQMRRYLPNVRDYVMGGGGFAMIGGDLSFASGGYAGTEVAEVLPVGLPPGRDPSRIIDATPFRPVLTEAGQRHPLTRIAFDREQNRRIWESLPQMSGTNVVLEATPDATVLAEHPRLRAGRGAMPVLTVAERGEGRVLALTVDDAWRWNFENVARGESARTFTSFWNSTIRWLIRDPALNLIQVDVPQRVYAPGAEVQIQTRVFEADYSPANGAQGELVLMRRDLDALDQGDAVEVARHPFVTDERGRTTWTVRVDEPGAWSVQGTAQLTDGTSLADDDLFLVLAQSGELRQVDGRPRILERLSEATEGSHTVLPRLRTSELTFRPARIDRVDRREVVDLWRSPLALLLLAMLLTVEWLMRRRWGRA